HELVPRDPTSDRRSLSPSLPGIAGVDPRRTVFPRRSPLMAKPIRVGVIGVGHWGPNLVRIFYDHPDTELAAVCDRDKGRCELIARRYANVPVLPEPEPVLKDESIHAVVIATSASSHFALAKAALLQGKHVLVEKPITTNAAEGQELAQLARE